MSLVGNKTDAYARTTISSLMNAGQRIAASVWAKADTSNLGTHLVTMSVGSSLPIINLMTSSGPQWRSNINGTQQIIGTPSNGVWTHIGAVYGPWKDEATDPTCRVYLNGSYVAQAETAATLSTADFTRITLLASYSGTPDGFWGGRIAEMLFDVVANDADADALMALCYTQAVTATALGRTPKWSRRLVDDFTTGAGTGNPTGGGSYSFASGDHPSLSTDPPASPSTRRRAVMIGF